MLRFLAESPLVDRLGWVLVHSLWQFAVIALAAALGLRALRHHSAAARYAAALAGMALMVAAPLATAIVLPQPSVPILVASSQAAPIAPQRPLSQVSAPTSTATAQPADLTPPDGSVTNPQPTAGAIAANVADRSDRWAAVRRTLESWLPQIVATWSAGVLLFALRPLIGWWTVRSLRRRGLSPVPEALQQKLQDVAARLGLRRTPRIAQSSRVTVPMMVGWLRPLVLLPFSVVSGLPSSQVEAILAHELAHIRRHDYLVNVAQMLVETLFFYHPAVWWLSRRVRDERENCCDDLAVAALGNRVEYGRALLAIEELRGAAPALALSARGGSLLARVRRLVATPARTRSFAGAAGWLPLLTLLLVAACWWITQTVNAARTTDTPPESAGQPAALAKERAAWVSLFKIRSMTIDGPDRNASDSPIQSANFWRTAPEAWPLIGQLVSLRDLGFTASNLTPENAATVAQLTDLRTLSVVNGKCGLEVLAQLGPLTNLEHLEMMFTVFDWSDEDRKAALGELTADEQSRRDQYLVTHPGLANAIDASLLTDRAMTAIGPMQRLRSLRLVNTLLTDAGLQHLAGHPALEDLDIGLLELNPESAHILSELTSLRRFRYATADDAGIEALAKLTKLEELELYANGLTNQGVDELLKLTSLKKLAIRGNQLTDEGLLQLAGLSQLESLDVQYSKQITAEGVARLQEQLPDCVIAFADPAVDLESSPKITYDCTIVDRDSGAPIPNAKISWRIDRAYPTIGSKPLWTGSFTSDDQGRYQVLLPERVVEFGNRLVWIEASHPDYLPVTGSGYPFYLPDADAGIQPDHRRLRLKRGVEVTGRFLLPDGSPAKDLVVMVARDREGFGDSTGFGFFTKTNADGRFRLVTAEGWPQRLHWFPENHVADSRALTKNFGEQSTIRLKDGPRLNGRIVDRDGKPLAGLVIQAATGTRVPLLHATSDENGQFRFGPSPPGEYTLLPVRHYVNLEGRFVTAKEPPPFDGIAVTLKDSTPITLQAPETVTIRIRVVDAAGKPVEGRRITEDGWPIRFESQPVKDQPGLYEISVPQGQDYRAFVLDRQGDEAVVFRGDAPKGVELRTATNEPAGWLPGHSLRIRMDDAGVPDINIEARGTIQVQPAGTIKVVVKSEGGERVDVSNILFEIEYADVEKFREAGGGDARGFTQISVAGDPPGRRIEGVVPNLPLKIRLSGGGYAAAEETVEAAAGETKTVEFLLKPAATDGAGTATPEPPADAPATGTGAAPEKAAAALPKFVDGAILDADGQPIGGAEVGLQVWGYDQQERLPTSDFVAVTRSNVDGTFRLSVPAEIDPGNMLGTVWAVADGFVPVRPTSYGGLAGLIGEPTEVRLLPAKPVTVRVLANDGTPAANVRVRVSSQRLPESIGWPTPARWAGRLEGVTNADGDAHVPGAIPDAIDGLILAREGLADVWLDANFFLNARPAESGPTFTVQLPPVGDVEGRLVPAAGVELPRDLKLRIQTASRLPSHSNLDAWGQADVAIDAEGKFAIRGMAAGRILVLPFLTEEQPLRAIVPSRLNIKAGLSNPLDIAIVKGVVVRGQIRKADTKAGCPEFRLNVIYGQSAREHDSMYELFTRTTDADGRFTVVVPPGPIELRLRSYVPGYDDIESWRPGHKGVWGTQFIVPDGVAEFDLEPIELDPAKAVNGKLVDADGEPLSDWTVYGYPQIPGVDQESVMNSFAGVHTNEKGEFSGQSPVSFLPTFWKVSHRDWPTPFEFEDKERVAKVLTEDPLVIQVPVRKADVEKPPMP